jgi:hypothetical protein
MTSGEGTRHPNASIAMSPDQGSRRFRRTARLALEDGALVATDRRGRHHRFPLDGTADAPVRFEVTFSSKEHGRGQFVYFDGKGQGLIVGFVGDWDAEKQTELNDLAGIPLKLTDPPLPPLRSDGCRLEDIKWADVEYVATVATIGGVIAFATTADFLPDWLGWSLIVPIVIYIVAAISTGTLARPRMTEGELRLLEEIENKKDEEKE